MSHHKAQQQKSAEPAGDDLRIVDITDKTIVVVGKETSHLKDHLKELGGEYDRKHKGYSFSANKRADLEKFISIQLHESNDHGAASSSAGASSKQTEQLPGLAQEVDEGFLRTHMKSSQSASDQPSSTASVAGSKQESPYIVHHTARSIAVINASEEFKDSFLEHGGKFNKAIKIGDEKLSGWTFAHKDLEAVKGILPDAPVHEHHEAGGGDVSPRESAASSSAPKDSPAAVAGKRKAASASRKETSAQVNAMEQVEEEGSVEAPEDVEEAEEGAQGAGGAAAAKRKAAGPVEEEGGSQAGVTAQEA
jgi:hypothetical protein